MQRTEKYFENDAFLKTAAGVILAAEADAKTGGGRIALDGTVFYPEGGGQPADRGTLTLADGTVLHVTDVHETNGIIWHTVDALPETALSPVPPSPAPSTGSGASTRCSSTPASTSSPASCTRCSGRRTWASISAPTPCGWTPVSPSPPRACGRQNLPPTASSGRMCRCSSPTPPPKSWRR